MSGKRIVLIGYGKMGKTIEQIAKQRGNTISHIIDVNNQSELQYITSKEADVAIEFTQPESAILNLRTCINNKLPIVCGTTGWLEHRAEIERLCTEKGSAFFYASNFSIGVNIFFKVNESLARMMAKYPTYRVSMEEIHHTQKKDAPSGTAITLAEGVIGNISQTTEWKLADEIQNTAHQIPITALRIPDVPGTHTVFYKSPIDDIETGAVFAAEFLAGKKGIYGMDDLLGF
jgi:4-hydroxy-tetrahydrodipicolinate reductase